MTSLSNGQRKMVHDGAVVFANVESDKSKGNNQKDKKTGKKHKKDEAKSVKKNEKP